MRQTNNKTHLVTLLVSIAMFFGSTGILNIPEEIFNLINGISLAIHAIGLLLLGLCVAKAPRQLASKFEGKNLQPTAIQNINTVINYVIYWYWFSGKSVYSMTFAKILAYEIIVCFMFMVLCKLFIHKYCNA